MQNLTFFIVLKMKMKKIWLKFYIPQSWFAITIKLISTFVIFFMSRKFTHFSSSSSSLLHLLHFQSFSLSNIFQLHKYQIFVLINGRNMSKSQFRSCKLMSCKRLVYQKRGVAILSFLLLAFIKHFWLLSKILWKKPPFLFRTFKFLRKFYHVTSFFDPETLKIEFFFSNFARMFLFVTNYF